MNTYTRRLIESRMRDVRRHQKSASAPQVRRKFKDVYQALGELSGTLNIMKRDDLSSQVDEVEGMIRGIQKEF